MSDVWGVFSAFRPDDRLLSAVRAMLAEVGDRVVVVDDGSGEGWEDTWAALTAAGARVLHADANGGIATALNRGIAAAFTAGADAVVTFDQDSAPGTGFVGRLLRAEADAHASGRRVGVVVPEYFAGVSQVGERHDGVLLARNSIQSGALIPRLTVEKVGGFREDLFIDLVDTEYELRCLVEGLDVIAAPGLSLGHELGRRYARRFLGRPVRLPVLGDAITLSAPFRYYYRIRNRRVLNRAYRTLAPRRILRDSLREVPHFIEALWVARPRRAMWRLYRAGWRDGGRGRLGRMPRDLESVAASIRWSAPEI